METTDLVGLLIPNFCFAMLATEWRWPARRFSERRRWRWIGIGFLLNGSASLGAPAQPEVQGAAR